MIWDCHVDKQAEHRSDPYVVPLLSSPSNLCQPMRPAGCADFSPDGTLLAVGYGNIVTLWRPDTLTLVGTLPHTERVTAAKFLAGTALLVGRHSIQLLHIAYSCYTYMS
jgi:hypothetical protein